MAKKRICIVFGGQSSEHEISCISASNVIENIDKSKYDVMALGITRDGCWYLTGAPVSAICDGSWQNDESNKRAFIPPDAGIGGVVVLDGDGFKTVPVDAAFGIMHGLWGEDGTIQGLFELARIPYVGSGVAASANAMDKVFSKIIFGAAGFKMAKWLWLRRHEMEADLDGSVALIESALPYDVFVKPANAGSSVGVAKAHNREELINALKLAALHDEKIIVEEAIIGQEIECAVLGNRNPIASVCGEILPAKEFYDYEAKYNDSSSRTVIPPNMSDELSQKVRESALRAYKALDCAGLSRVDFFVTSGGEVVLNEINTIPGFTAISMYPKMFEASGIGYCELIDRLISLALEKAEVKND